VAGRADRDEEEDDAQQSASVGNRRQPARASFGRRHRLAQAAEEPDEEEQTDSDDGDAGLDPVLMIGKRSSPTPGRNRRWPEHPSESIFSPPPDGSKGDDSAVQAMLLDAQRQPLRQAEVEPPSPERGQVLVRVHACAVCRTDLHIVDGDLAAHGLPRIPGHQIVGTVEASGDGAGRFGPGDRVGVPWLGWTDGECRYCRSDRENLCDNARFTGYDLDGGYAELTVADERFCFGVPDDYGDLQAAPLLCAGLIGYRSLRLCGDAERVGLYGFGSSAHIICQVAAHQGRRVFAFTRAGDEEGQAFARELGAEWAGPSDGPPPEELDGAIVFAPVGALVPVALRASAKGAAVVCAGIHMSEIPGFPYEILWGERRLLSVANLTRRDGEEFMRLAPQVPVKTEIADFPLGRANEALDAVRTGAIRGTAVLTVA
jgi:propanol-preferring alcohol dehydrogenase